MAGLPKGAPSVAEKDKSIIVGMEKTAELEENPSESDKELPEPIRPGKQMPGLPPLGLREMTDILCRPNIPEERIMKLVANKLNSFAYESDDTGSDGSNGKVIGMQGLFDCIIETTLCQSDHSDSNSDDDDEDYRPREHPCTFCSKIFLSPMRLNAHVLVAHSGQDTSLLNENHAAKRRRELQRSLSREKKAGSGASSPKVKPLSQDAVNRDMATLQDELVKHLPPKQRAKVSPRARLQSKDQVDQMQGGEQKAEPPSLITSDSVEERLSEGAKQSVDLPGSTVQSSRGKELDKDELQSSASGRVEVESDSSEQEQCRVTRLRRRSSALTGTEQKSSSVSPSPSPSTSRSSSCEKSMTSKTQNKSSLSISSKASSKRKSIDSPKAAPEKRARQPSGPSGGDRQRRRASTRQSR